MENSTSKVALRSPSDLCKEAWSIYKAKYKTFVGIMILPLSLAIIFSLLVAGDNLKTAFSSLTTQNLIIQTSLLVLFVIILKVTQMWGDISLLYAIKNREDGIKESYQQGLSRIVSYFWIGLLLSFVIIGGFVLFIVPGIIFSTWFSLALFILIDEDLHGMDALMRSKEYVRGRWRDVFVQWFILGLFIMVPTAIVSLISGLLPDPLGETVSTLVSGLVIGPVGIVYAYLLYQNIKATKLEFATPAKEKKYWFTIIGLFGFLIIPLFALLTVFFLMWQSEHKLSSEPTQQVDTVTTPDKNL